MKIRARIKPTYDACCACLDLQEDGKIMHKDCEKCLKDTPYREVLQFGHTLFIGDWAMVLTGEGDVVRIPIHRLYDVRTSVEC